MELVFQQLEEVPEPYTCYAVWRGADLVGFVEGWKASTSYAWLPLDRAFQPLRDTFCVRLYPTRALAATALAAAATVGTRPQP
jgi:hypothetical protein